ncbi:hypothetical protein ACIPY2_19055 [Paenarthrobacter sp. NPDC089675]|uniref:hypothetical protein n=1 Tax=Paenarthrobacter sp. NPDC089675 TaxID=3364376 RepID=UPI003807B3CB
MGQEQNGKPGTSGPVPGDSGQWQDNDGGSPTTQQMRTVGQRRREAERKLDQHLEEAKHRAESPDPDQQKTES